MLARVGEVDVGYLLALYWLYVLLIDCSNTLNSKFPLISLWEVDVLHL
jgi:hypothetical protein